MGNECGFCGREVNVMAFRGGKWCCENHRKILTGEKVNPITGKKGVLVEEPAALG